MQRRTARFVLSRYRNISSINSVLDALNWPTLERCCQISRFHAGHYHCCRGPLFTPCPASTLLLWTITDHMPVITPVAMDVYWPLGRHDHGDCGPLLTSCLSSPLLVWTITDSISVITTVVMDLFWPLGRHDHSCYGPLKTPFPS